jgi:S-DNA-T family DNA segregation ATPase FtsK/SpoIIIE
MNFEYFGYIAYINMLILFYFIYRWFRASKWTKRGIEIVLSSSILMLAILIFQAIFISDVLYKSTIGMQFISFLQPFVGLVGAFIFSLLLSVVSLFILSNFSLYRNLNRVENDFNNTILNQEKEKHTATIEKGVLKNIDTQIPVILKKDLDKNTNNNNDFSMQEIFIKNNSLNSLDDFVIKKRSINEDEKKVELKNNNKSEKD